MKKLILIAVLGFLSYTMQAQVKFGLRGGISTYDINSGDMTVSNEETMDSFIFKIKEAKYGVHFGVFLQGQIGKFFIQPEVLFNSNKVDFEIDDIIHMDKALRTEKYQYLDIPVMMGFKFGHVRLQGGPVGHVFINSKSDLFNVEGYKQKFEELTYGWQAGLGLDFWKFVLDFKYEGNFNKFGDHMVIGNHQYNFDSAPSRFIVSLGFAF